MVKMNMYGIMKMPADNSITPLMTIMTQFCIFLMMKWGGNNITIQMKEILMAGIRLVFNMSLKLWIFRTIIWD